MSLANNIGLNHTQFGEDVQQSNAPEYKIKPGEESQDNIQSINIIDYENVVYSSDNKLAYIHFNWLNIVLYIIITVLSFL